MSTVLTPTGARAPAGALTPAVTSAAVPNDSPPRRMRIGAIDIIRGAVMVLMAIDHVRVYAGVPAGGPTPGVFFTRWITHFCAPAFIFLAGTSAFLHGEKLRDRGALARFLLTRGAWLVLLELTVLRIAWTFNLDFGHYLLAGVIWVIGWCMILMAGLVRLPSAAVGAIGLAIVLGHNLVDPYLGVLAQKASASGWSWFWQILYFGGPVAIGGENGPRLAVLYSIVPWIGVIAAGYGFGPVMRMDADRRRRLCFMIGGIAVVAFLVLRGFNLYGDPRPWGDAARRAQQQRLGAQRTAASTATPRGAPTPSAPAGQPAPRVERPQPPPTPALLQFLGTNKYPASLLFLLMTLGPTLLAIPLLERAHGRVANVLTVFGRVPFFYYVLHIPLIHLIFVGLSLVRFGTVIPWMTANHPMFNPPPPPGYPYSLAALYLIWAVTVAILYLPCRWFAALKRRRSDRWLSYL